MHTLSSEVAARVRDADTVVFDVGNVLLRFSPERIAEKFFPEERRRALFDAVFSPSRPWRWSQFDKGLWDNAYVAARIAEEASLPGAEEEILFALANFHQTLTPLPLSREISALKDAGKRVFALTNYPWPAFDSAWKTFDFFRLFDGALVSAKEKMWKPNPDFFELLCARYAIAPGRALFIDDLAENVETAEKLGFKTWNYPFPGK